MEKLLLELNKLSDEEKLQLINECIKDNKEILYYTLLTKEDVIEDLYSLSISEDIKDWLNNTSIEMVFEIVENHCDTVRLYDYEHWDMSNENILSYICFEEDDFIEEVEKIIIQEKRDKVLNSFINTDKNHQK
jgi:hypothetical protein